MDYSIGMERQDMNVRATSVVLALLLVINTAVLAETTTQYIRDGDENTEVTLFLQGGEVDDGTTVRFPNAEVLDASYVVSGGADSSGNYAEDVSVTVSGTNWQYSGEGYGALGYQNEFNDSSMKKSAVFPEEDGGETSIEILLPANATISDAEVTLSGLPPGSGELDDYRLTSENTNGGSYSTNPSVVIDGSDAFTIWLDDGDLEERTENYDYILFNSRGSSWDDTSLIYENEIGYILSNPILSGDSDYLGAIWGASGYLEGLYSTNEGSSWSDVYTYESDYYVYYHDLEVVDGTFYVALSAYAPGEPDDTYDYRVYFTMSDDNGNSWSTPLEISDSNTATRNIAPKIEVDGDDVHVVWLGSPSGTELVLYYASSSNEGTSFGTGTQLSGSSTVSDLSITCNGDNLVVSWSESGTDESSAMKARASSNGGNTFNSELTVSSADDISVNAPSSTNDGSNNFYISWTRIDSNDNNKIVVARSTNSGTSWNTPVQVDDVGDDTQRGLSSITASSSRVGVIWVDVYDGNGASSDADIFYSYSTNDGSSWSSMEEAGSDQYYEADSYATALAHSNNYLYSVYWDGGDNDPQGDSNGNDVMNDDGDIFFRRSADDGESWDDAVVISNSDDDGRSYDPPSYSSYYYSYYRSDISASSSNVYVVWSNYDYDKTQWEIRFSASSNSGSTWSEPEVISANDDEVNSYAPTIISNGDDIYVAWQQYRSDSTTFSYDIVYRHSSNGGSSWNSEVYVTETLEGTQYVPEIAYGNNVVHLTWHAYSVEGDGAYTIEYASSDDDGDSWELQTLHDPSNAGDFCWFPTITTDGNNVIVVWQDDGDWDGDGTYDADIVVRISEDNGESWGDTELVIDSDTYNFLYMLPSVAAADGFIYISFQELIDGVYDHYFTLSQDYGSSWSDGHKITNGHLINYAKMDMAIADKTYFGYYDDTNIHGETNDDVDIFIRATLDEGYPTNPTINLDGGSDDWDWPGEFNQDNSPVKWDDAGEDGASKSFAEAISDGLQEAVSNGDTFVDDYGVEMARITITVTSDTDGRIGFQDLSIEYDIDFTVDQDLLVTRLNNAVAGTDESEEDVETKFSVTSSTDGKVVLKDLEIITAEADLEITQMDLSNSSPKEGSDLIITVHVKNTGEGEAKATIDFVYDGDQHIGTRALAEIGSGDTKSISITWSDLPEGSHEITATIVDSVPKDKSQGSEDTISQTVNIQEANPEITTDFSLDGIATEDTEVGWTLSLENEGEKYGNVIAYLYEDEKDEDNLIYESPQTKIDVEATKEFSGIWLANGNVEQFYLEIVDADNGEILNDDGETFDVSVQKLPKLSITKIEWIDDDDNLITSFSDGTVAYAKIYVMNEGTFDVTASIDLSLTKSDKKLVPSPNYGANIAFNGESETLLMINGEYPKVLFYSEGSSGFTGAWTVEIKMSNIMASSGSEQIWDSEELTFEDKNNRVIVAEPPDLQMISFSSSNQGAPIREGTAVELKMEVSNEGEATASGDVKLLREGSVFATLNFTVEGYSTTTLTYNWAAPTRYDGEVNLRAEIDALSVSPPGGPSDIANDNWKTITLTIEGTMEQGGGSSGSSTSMASMLVPIAVFGVLIAGLGGAFFMYKRTAVNTIDDDLLGNGDAFGPPDTQPPPATPPMTPPQPEVPPVSPQPEQPPAAAPPPEQPPAPQPEQAPPVAPPQETILNITVPAGAQPGQQIQIKAPDGRVVAVTVPEGMQPGSQFQVKI